MTGKLAKLSIVAAITLLAYGCLPLDGTDRDTVTGSISDSTSFGDGPEQIWLSKAKTYYRTGNFGLAERFYRQAIEERSNNAEAWLGLAASYDQMKRFDLADQAYARLTKMTGYTPTVLNNLAYHHMLKGDYARARHSLTTAAEADPSNPYILNNMELLESWEVKAKGGWEPKIAKGRA